MHYIGIDIRSTASKTAVFKEEKLVSFFTQPTGWSSVETAEAIKSRIIEAGYFDDSLIIATGYKDNNYQRWKCCKLHDERQVCSRYPCNEYRT